MVDIDLDTALASSSDSSVCRIIQFLNFPTRNNFISPH